MFIFRWLKKLLILALIVLALAWLADHTSFGRNAKKRVVGFFKSELFSEGIKDLKVLTGEALKGVGDKLQEDVTPKEQKELDSLFQKKLLKESGGMAAVNKPAGEIKKGKSGVVPTKNQGARGGQETTMAKPIKVK